MNRVLKKIFPQDTGWYHFVKDEFEKEYFKNLENFLEELYRQKKTIFPVHGDIFSAFNYTPFEKVKVVIIGQDPYHGEGQAHGLLFSVKKGIRIPPSLKNIFKELNKDVGMKIPDHGYLDNWARQGILLLNTILTVEEGSPASHRKKGWEIFTDKIISVLNERHSGLVFVLWGNFAQEKGNMIDKNKHLVLEAKHPSPLSANRGFFGCRHFSRINEYLADRGEKQINWEIN